MIIIDEKLLEKSKQEYEKLKQELEEYKRSAQAHYMNAMELEEKLKKKKGQQKIEKKKLEIDVSLSEFSLEIKEVIDELQYQNKKVVRKEFGTSVIHAQLMGQPEFLRIDIRRKP